MDITSASEDMQAPLVFAHAARAGRRTRHSLGRSTKQQQERRFRCLTADRGHWCDNWEWRDRPVRTQAVRTSQARGASGTVHRGPGTTGDATSERAGPGGGDRTLQENSACSGHPRTGWAGCVIGRAKRPGPGYRDGARAVFRVNRLGSARSCTMGRPTVTGDSRFPTRSAGGRVEKGRVEAMRKTTIRTSDSHTKLTKTEMTGIRMQKLTGRVG